METWVKKIPVTWVEILDRPASVKSVCSGLIFFLALLSPLPFPAPALGQTSIPPAGESGIIEKLIPQSQPEFEPPPEEEPPEIIIEDGRKVKDPGAGPSFFVSKIVIEGNTLIDNDTLAPLIDVGEGIEVTLGVLNLFAQEITALYVSKGYFLTRAHIPQQKVDSGEVVIKVVEARVGKISVVGNEKYEEEDFIARMWRVREEAVLKEQTLERVLLELNDVMGVETKSTLRPGEEYGTSDMVVNVKETRPFSISIDWDNFGSEFTGKNRFGVTAVAGNTFLFGDRFSVRGVKSEADQNFVSPSYIVPINKFGTTANFTFVYSNYVLGSNLNPLNASGNSFNYRAGLVHPVQRSRTQSFHVKGGFGYRKIKNNIFGALSTDHNLAEVYTGLGGNFQDGWRGRTFYDLNLLFGLTNRDPADPFNSRLLGNEDTIVTNLNLTRYQSAFFLNSFFTLKMLGQVADKRVVSPNQFAVGGMGTVRGYPLAEISGDEGIAGSIEYNLPFPNDFSFGKGFPKLSKMLTLFGFLEFGRVFVKDRQPGESDKTIAGAGGGFRINIPKSSPDSLGYSFALVYGAPVFDSPAPSDGSFGILYLSGLISF